MNIELNKITIRELSKNFKDNAENGVTGFDGKLDIRPPYQREFIYKDKQRDAVINTVIKKYPLNIMYWAVRKNETFKIIDGQQKTISIFTNKRKKFMKGVTWGLLYNTHKDVMYDTKAIEVETAKLIADDEVERQRQNNRRKLPDVM